MLKLKYANLHELLEGAAIPDFKSGLGVGLRGNGDFLGAHYKWRDTESFPSVQDKNGKTSIKCEYVCNSLPYDSQVCVLCCYNPVLK